MSKKITNKFSIVFLCFILSFYSTGQSKDNIDNFIIQTWIENVPILSSLIENKRDVVEFDSSNGKIISISFDTNCSWSQRQFCKNSLRRRLWPQKRPGLKAMAHHCGICLEVN